MFAYPELWQRLEKKLKRKKITKERSLSFSASLYEDVNWDTKLAM